MYLLTIINPIFPLLLFEDFNKWVNKLDGYDLDDLSESLNCVLLHNLRHYCIVVMLFLLILEKVFKIGWMNYPIGMFFLDMLIIWTIDEECILILDASRIHTKAIIKRRNIHQFIS